MKSIMLATVALFGFVSAASALDFGNGLALNTDIANEYNTETQVFTSIATPHLGYAPIEGLAVWAETDVALYNGDQLIKFDGDTFEGATLGVTYVPNVDTGKVSVEAYVENNFNGDFDYVDSVIGVSLSF